MSSFSNENLANALDAYLDDQLSTEDRARFEHAMLQDPPLREAMNAQRQLDQSLRRMFAAPFVPQALMHKITAPQNGHAVHQNIAAGADDLYKAPSQRERTGLWRFRISAKAAAVILFFLLAGPFAVHQALEAYETSRTHVSKNRTPQPLDLAYTSEVAGDFQTAAACGTATDTDPLSDISRARFGESLALQKLPPNVQLIGLNFANLISPYTVAVLLTVDNHPVVVFIESVERDPGQNLSETNPSLHLFKRQVGSMVLYEVSPLEKPSVIDYFYKP